MGFNFSLSNESAVRNVRRPLAPWEIHDVKFMGVELKEFAGKKDPSKTYKTFNIKFENEDGYFNVNQFYPKDGDDQRREYTSSNGGKMIMPSNFDTLKALISQTIQVLNPDKWKSYVDVSSKFRSVDDMIAAFAKVMESAVGTQTKLKLVGKNRDGKVVADIPRIVAVNNSTDYADVAPENKPTYISDNYIGDKLYFSDYEETQRAKFTSSTPTKMPSDTLNIVEPEQKTDDNEFDLESLL